MAEELGRALVCVEEGSTDSTGLAHAETRWRKDVLILTNHEERRGDRTEYTYIHLYEYVLVREMNKGSKNEWSVSHWLTLTTSLNPSTI